MYPKIGEYVVVKINEVNDHFANVQLLTYDLPGMIVLSELSKKRVSKSKFIDKIEVAVVLFVDEAKSHINLSKWRVSKEDAEECKKSYFKSIAAVVDKPITIRADVMVQCFTEDGVEAIKKSFEGVDEQIRIRLIHPPDYAMFVTTSSENEEQIKTWLTEEIEKIREVIRFYGGNLKITENPYNHSASE